MPKQGSYSKAVGDLRALLTGFKPGQKTFDEIVAPRDQVLAKYQPIFAKSHIANLTKEEFVSFLYFDNNHQWSGLYRKGLGAASNMDQLRQAIALLVDDELSISERFPKAMGRVAGLGKALATSILLASFPDKYGVWNNTSEAALLQLGIFPPPEKGQGVGKHYEKINRLLLELSKDLSIDLWTIDALWWFLLEPNKLPPSSGSGGTGTQQAERFALERQLEDFLLENWDRTSLAKDWTIFADANDPEAGNQYPTEVGRIDILAVHKREPKFLVIELKRDQSTDQTVGQALRYVGWVKHHLATTGQKVEALIISHAVEKEAHYALSTIPNVKLMTYEIDFHLKEVEPLKH